MSRARSRHPIAAILSGIVVLFCAFNPSAHTGAATGGSALLVVGTPSALGAGDIAVRDRLGQQGLTVTVVDDSAVTASTTTGKSLVLVSSTVTASAIGTRLTGVPVPLIAWEGALYDDLGMTSLAGTKTSGQQELSIVGGDHPLAAGMSGTQAVTTAVDDFWWGVPSDAAIEVATLAGDPGKVAIFGYESGASMAGRSAPARRVGLFIGDTTASRLTPAGASLLDAAISWAAGSSTSPTPTPTAAPTATPTGSGDLVMQNDLMTVAQGCGTLDYVLANDRDPDGDPLAVMSIEVAPAHGTATVYRTAANVTVVRYQAANNYAGPDSLTYGASDGHGETATATLAVTVLSVPGDADGDGLLDGCDPFGVDPNNATSAGTFALSFDTGYVPGHLLGDLGFQGLMTNNRAGFGTLYSESEVTVANGMLAVANVDAGDAVGDRNDARFGFLRGFVPPSSDFTVYGTVCAPYPPANSQSVGIFVGLGDQDNYIKAVVDRSGGISSVHDTREVDGANAGIAMRADSQISTAACIELRIMVIRATGKYVPSYSLNGGAKWIGFGGDAKRRTVPADWLSAGRPLAAGLFSTRVRTTLPGYSARWDRLGVVGGRTVPPG